MRTELGAILDEIPTDFGGGCNLKKAYLLAWLIREFDMKTTLDIGVHRGRSLFPQAFAHHEFTGGAVYGVDPWSAAEAVQEDKPELKAQMDAFIAATDFRAIYQEVASKIRWWSYEKNCTLLRTTSERAIGYCRKRGVFFDLIHIDGNHDTEKVMLDVELYVPRLRREGFIILDDISWDSVRPAHDKLAETMLPICSPGGGDYAVFRASPLRARLARFGG